jgi:hypothetical protein
VKTNINQLLFEAKYSNAKGLSGFLKRKKTLTP